MEEIMSEKNQKADNKGIDKKNGYKERVKFWTGWSFPEVIPEIILGISTVLILAGVQLVYRDFYYDILEVKYRYYYTCALGAVGLCVIYSLLFERTKWKNLKGKKWFDLFNGVDTMVIVFTLLAVVSTILSPFQYEAFWGNEGRYIGSFLLLIFAAYYFCMTRFYKGKMWHIEFFLIAGILMCLLGITDSFDMDLLGFKTEIDASERYMFTSTVGNINTYTACVAMVMAVAGVLFASSKGILKNIWYGVCVLISIAALIIGESDNAYLSLAMFFGFLPLYLFRDRRGFRKYVTLLAMFCTVVYGLGIEQKMLAGVVKPIYSLFGTIVAFSWLPKLTAGLWILVLVLWILEYAAGRKKEEKNQEQAIQPKRSAAIGVWLWLGVIGAVVCVVLWVLYDVNVAGNVAKYPGLEKYLLFNDRWGTNRGYAWRIAIENYQKFPLLQKLFGHGPDTFALISYFNNYVDMTGTYGVLFDNVHNEYLQYLVTIGIFGLLAYLGILAALVWDTVKRKLDDPLAMACLFAVLCYWAQAVVNINQPIGTPIMWTLLCITAARGRARESQVKQKM